MTGIIQIPFSGFKLIDLGQTVALPLYQSLYQDHSEPVGIFSVVQAFGLLQLSDEAIQDFNDKWKTTSRRWKLPETGIEVITGKSSTTGEMIKTRDGEVALIVLSFLVEALGAKTASDLAWRIIKATPTHLLTITPRKEQVANVVSAIQSQTGNASWHQEITEAQLCVQEQPVIWTGVMSTSPSSYDIPVEAMTTFYQTLCAVTRFPDDYYCILRTTLSVSLAFVLAHSICGLQVCVIIDGVVLYGNSMSGKWQVKLEREQNGAIHTSTEIKLGCKLENPEVLLKIDEIGPRRANRIAIKGIASAATINQGLGIDESNDIAKLSIWAAEFILQKWQRELADELANSYISFSESEDSVSLNAPADDTSNSNGKPRLVPVKSRLTIDAICTWWGCSPKTASSMLNATASISCDQSPGTSWKQLTFSQRIMGKITGFAGLNYEQQSARRLQNYHALDRKDFGRLTHMLTTQLLLITFLKGNALNQEIVRVRSSYSPEYSALGIAIRKLDSIKPLRQSDVLCSWHCWLQGESPKLESNYGLEAVSTNGYVIYRSLLLDLNLRPDSCELVAVEPGHISLDNQRLAEIHGPEDIPLVKGEPHHRERLQAQAKLKSRDHTGRINLSWRVAEGDSASSLDLEMLLKARDSNLEMEASVYHITKLSWGLEYGDRSLGCNHEEERVGTVFEGEKIELVSAGELRKSDSEWNTLQLLSAYGNDLGQVACLLSAPPDSHGMVRREACLRCCVTACNRRGMDFLID